MEHATAAVVLITTAVIAVGHHRIAKKIESAGMADMHSEVWHLQEAMNFESIARKSQFARLEHENPLESNRLYSSSS